MSPAEQLIAKLSAPGLFWGVAETGSPVELDPSEARAIAQATPKRQAEFRAGRLAARCAFAAAGLAAAPIPMAGDRSPVWPKGVTGSITHADGLAICALARGPMAVGIDLETDQELTDEIAQSICFDGDDQDVIRVFSAKEAAYKAIYPQCGVLFGFDGMRVRADCAQIVETHETRAIPQVLRAQDWRIQQARCQGRILSLCVTQL